MEPTTHPLWPGLMGTFLPASIRSRLGPLADLVEDPRVTDVFLLGNGRVCVDAGEGSYPVTDLWLSPSQAEELARGLLEAGGRHVDEANPLADVNLGHGVRVHAVLPPISGGGPTVSLRIARVTHPSLESLSLRNASRVIPRLIRCVQEKKTLLVTGATGSGKTTLLAALMSYVSVHERLVVLEDLAELSIDHPHVVSLECRQANSEGAGEITLTRLVREALRMRPTRLVVGECRGAELADLLQAFHTGHRGGATTLHAHSVTEVPIRLDSLGALSNLSPHQLARQAASAIDLVVHVDREADNSRRLTFGRLKVDSKGDLDVELEEAGIISRD